MDSRVTLNKKESFLSILEELFQANQKVSILYDNHGLTRYEGLIKAIKNEGAPDLVLGDGQSISLSSIVGVNGIFAPDYSEC